MRRRRDYGQREMQTRSKAPDRPGDAEGAPAGAAPCRSVPPPIILRLRCSGASDVGASERAQQSLAQATPAVAHTAAALNQLDALRNAVCAHVGKNNTHPPQAKTPADAVDQITPLLRRQFSLLTFVVCGLEFDTAREGHALGWGARAATAFRSLRGR